MMCEWNSSLYSSSSSGAKVTVGQINSLIRGKPKVPIKTKEGATAEINKSRDWKTCLVILFFITWGKIKSHAPRLCPDDNRQRCRADPTSGCSEWPWFILTLLRLLLTDCRKYQTLREGNKKHDLNSFHILGDYRITSNLLNVASRLSAELCLNFMHQLYVSCWFFKKASDADNVASATFAQDAAAWQALMAADKLCLCTLIPCYTQGKSWTPCIYKQIFLNLI